MKNILRMAPTFLGIVMTLSTFTFFISFIFALIYSENKSGYVFFGLFLVTLLIGLMIIYVKRKHIIKSPSFNLRDTIIWTVFSWVLVILISTVPFLVISNKINFVTSLFESSASWTTTGMSLLGVVSDIPQSLLLYKALIIWIGGFGIIVFMSIIIPALNKDVSKILMSDQKSLVFSSKIGSLSSFVKTFSVLYICLTVICFVFLVSFKMSVFPAIIHSLSSIATGGILAFDSGLTHIGNFTFEIIIAVFCILGALNFVIVLRVRQDGIKSFFKSVEIKGFFIILFSATALIFCCLLFNGTCQNPLVALHHSFIEVTSFMTTSGYIGVNYIDWPTITKIILFTLIFVGGCSNSTAGGIKIIRVLSFFAIIKRSIVKKLYPKSVVPVKISGTVISSETASDITGYIFMFIATFTLGAILLSFDGLSFSTTLSASIASLGNTGIGFGDMSNGEAIDAFSNYGYIIMSILMFVGRLEFFTVIIVFFPSFWKIRK